MRGQTEPYGDDDGWLGRAHNEMSTNPLYFYFDGINDHLTITGDKSNQLLLSHTMTISAWVLQAAQLNFSQTILSKMDQSSNTSKLILKVEEQEMYITFVEPDLLDTLQHFEMISSSQYVENGTWFYVTVTFDSTATYSTDLSLYKDGVLTNSATYATQFADIKDSVGVIGASLKPDSNRQNFFNGCIYQIFITNTVRTSDDIQNVSGNTPLPNKSGPCTVYEYPDSSDVCQDCVWNCDESTDTCNVNNSQCSICKTSLCTQCTGNGDNMCYACKINAILENNECICPHGTYNTDGGEECYDCIDACTQCYDGNDYSCTVCTGSYSYQPHASNACLDICPYGYSSTNNVCNGSDSCIALQFDKITRQWSTENGTPILFSELDSATSTDDQFTYKNRGAYFDGTDNLMTLDLAAKLYLHSSMSFHTWFYSQDTDGSLFSKSYNDYSSSTSSGFLDIQLSGAQSISVYVYVDGAENVATFSPAYNTNEWGHLAIIFDYDVDNQNTNLTFIVDGVTQAAQQTIDGGLVMDRLNSEGALGARFDGSATGRTVTNYFNGFIFSLNICIGTVTTTSITNTIQTNGCLVGSCDECPESLGECLWPCNPNEWYDGTSCQSCADCGAVHVSNWDGCVDGDNCSVCHDPECLYCDDFSSDECNTCIIDNSNTTQETGYVDCECSTNHYYEKDTHTCDQCDAYCAECFESTKYRCTQCVNDKYLQD